jgi:dipeptidyl aminopeptidase/acylaminoacyl peptidase
VVNVDGTGQHQLLTPPSGSEDEGAAFSPDGTKIAFMREPTDDSTGQLMLANADGSGTPVALTTAAAGIKDGEPNFSPDGTKIAFGRSPSDIDAVGSSDIYVINTDGTGEQNLTSGFQGESENPAFSPDGTMIAFGSGGQIHTMRADGTNPQPVSQPESGSDFDPNWQPLAKVASVAQVPECTGSVTVTVSDSTGFKSPPKAVHFQIDGGPEQTAPTTGATATINVPQGRHSLNYWGENQAGDQETTLHTVDVFADATRPSLTIRSDQRKATYRRGQFASVTIAARDSLSPLVRNPSRRRLRVSTATLGTKTVHATATDACGNTATALLRYRVVRAAVAHRRVVRPRFTG